MLTFTNRPEVPFQHEEYDQRLYKVRSIMKKKDIEVLLLRDNANIFYMTGHDTVGIQNYTILAIPFEGEVSLLVRYLEKPGVLLTSWLKDENIKTWEDHENPFLFTKNLLTERGWLNKRVAFEKSCRNLSVKDFENFEYALGLKLFDGSGIIEEVRKIKSKAEIEYIRKAARFSEIGMKAGMENLSAGKTENEVIAKVYEAMINTGSEYPSLCPILSGGQKSGIPHSNFRRLELKEGDAILFELGGVYNRYTGALMRSAVLGKANDKIKRMNEVCAEGLQAAIDSIRPGVTSGEVDEACRKVIEKAGFFENYKKRTGYSIGCSYPPDWGEGQIIDLKKDDPRVLEPGMVFHIPPALRVLNEYGVGVSETVVVTDHGCEVITNFDRKLFVAK